jgi:hypothetical protein
LLCRILDMRGIRHPDSQNEVINKPLVDHSC